MKGPWGDHVAKFVQKPLTAVALSRFFDKKKANPQGPHTVPAYTNASEAWNGIVDHAREKHRQANRFCTRGPASCQRLEPHWKAQLTVCAW